MEQEKHEKRLALARAEEDVARAKRELLEIENRERQFARRDLAVLGVQDQAQASESSSTAAGPFVVDSVADSGWSQANNLLNPSLDILLNNFLAGEASFNPASLLLGLPVDDTAQVSSGSL